MAALCILALIAALIIAKVVWTYLYVHKIGSFETEKRDILSRRDFLMKKVLVEPDKLVNKMPEIVGPQFQGEWALYSCSMFAKSLTNIAKLYPETHAESLAAVDELISLVVSPELRAYDTARWGEDPLESLSGSNSHISYLSHLAWMIANYKSLGGDEKYDQLYHLLCGTMNRRILASKNLNLPTYPGEAIYVPDMLVAIVALSEYSKQYNNVYESTVKKWLSLMKDNCLDRKTRLIPSFMTNHVTPNMFPLKGSYTALSCYYLSFIDHAFAAEQYEILKSLFFKKHPFAGIKEYHDKRCIFGMDIDAGPILFDLSPSGTAFAIGAATCQGDMVTRKMLLKTAEIAGCSVSCQGCRHYLLADIALVGEAIALAMRTSTAV